MPTPLNERRLANTAMFVVWLVGGAITDIYYDEYWLNFDT
jgi:hypothetical protein